MPKIKDPMLIPINGVYASTPIGICIPEYNAIGNMSLATTVWSLEQCCDLPYQLSLGIGPNCVAKNRNKALERLDSHIEWILMCDDDIVASPHFASKMLKVFEDHTVGLVSAVMLGMRGEAQNDLYPGHVGPGEVRDTTPPGTFIMYNRKATPIEWDENYQGSQWEDTDAMKQIKAMSLRTIGIGDVQIMHHNNALKGGKPKFWDENRTYFESKWGKLS